MQVSSGFGTIPSWIILPNKPEVFLILAEYYFSSLCVCSFNFEKSLIPILFVSVQLTSDNVRVTVSRATIDDIDVLNNDSIKMMYVEYSFLGIPLEETETPFSLPKSSDKGMHYNFTKGFNCISMLCSPMIKFETCA